MEPDQMKMTTTIYIENEALTDVTSGLGRGLVRDEVPQQT